MTMKKLPGELNPEQKGAAALLCLVLVGGIGWVDYLTGYHISLLSLYVLPTGLALYYVGRFFAIFIAIASVFVKMASDRFAGQPYAGPLVVTWNAGIFLSIFLIVIYLLSALKQALEGLEIKVAERTQALSHEMRERERLEREILDLTEKERQRFGNELHDVVCQELASIAIASHMLTKKLQGRQAVEEANARELAGMVDHTLAQTRRIARGFFTAGFDVDGLAEALRETARGVEERTGIHCAVRWPESFVISNEDVVLHFFRIAQEAIQNAVRHGRASQIEVSLGRTVDTVQLVVDDNGRGLTVSETPGSGLGLRIMHYRSGIIGGELQVSPGPSGGTRIACRIPATMIARGN